MTGVSSADGRSHQPEIPAYAGLITASDLHDRPDKSARSADEAIRVAGATGSSNRLAEI